MVAMSLPGMAQEHSVLAQGAWFKLAVTQSGVYRLNPAFFNRLGIDISRLNPAHLKIYGNGGGMLPQANGADRTPDLAEVPVQVAGEAEGRFDALLFYAEGPARVRYDTRDGRFSHELNFYSDTAFYFLNIGDSPGLRIQSRTDGLHDAVPAVTTFDDYWYHEEESVNLLQSGREWWGEYLSGTPLSLRVKLPGIVPGEKAAAGVRAVAAAQVPTRFNLLINGNLVGDQVAGTVSNGRYDLKGQISEKTYQLDGAGPLPDDFELRVVYDKTAQANAAGYLDHVWMHVKRKLAAYGGQQVYWMLPGETEKVNYQVGEVPEGWQLWDISDPRSPSSVRLVGGTGRSVSFAGTDGRRLSRYVGFGSQDIPEPVAWQKVANQDIRSAEAPDLLIVTAPLWKPEAERLAAFRRDQDGLDVLVVTTVQVYNEFASGSPDASAIRDFCVFLDGKSPGKLAYLLLFGDATYDYRHRKLSHPDRPASWSVPVYESRESLHPLSSFSSDDYYGFLNADEGEWVESAAGDHVLRLGIGRLPVRTSFEARTVVDKLIHYGTGKSSVGGWKNRVVFVADDGDSNIHQEQTDSLARMIEREVLPRRIFLDAYDQVSTDLGERAPEVNRQIREAINTGALILTFTGHGGITGWTDEQVFSLGDIQEVRGYDNLPLLITATCEFGRYDDPAITSGAELMMASPRGGAMGAITTTRPVLASSNFLLNQAFYEGFLALGRTARLGDLVRYTKNHSLKGSLNRNFALIGDPSMRLARPGYGVAWDEIPDTLAAGRRVKLKGKITAADDTLRLADFGGLARVSVFNRKGKIRTKGTNGRPDEYGEYNTKLYEGAVEVVAGRFEVDFIVPLDAGTTVGEGLTAVYAVSEDSLTEAYGHLACWSGGGEMVSSDDRTPPRIEAWVDDHRGARQPRVFPESVLHVKLEDESGINLAGAGEGRPVSVTLNDTLTFVLNDYYQGDAGDYGSGQIRFPWRLQPGSYRAVIRAWDTFNNPSAVPLEFIVGAAEGIRIAEAVVYPNPFDTHISFKIEQNRELQDAEITFRLMTLSGQVLHRWQKMYYNIDKIIADDIKLEIVNSQVTSVPALYLYELVIRSSEDNSADRKSGKIIHQR